MRPICVRLAVTIVVFFVAFGVASGTAAAQGCVRIDEPRDTLTPAERTAAVLLLTAELERTGRRMTEGNCQDVYTLSHARLGITIVVTLSGPGGTRTERAVGLDDLPAVYSQMVRSLQTGQPVGSFAVVDRTNVTTSQDQLPRRMQSDGFCYARIGGSSLFTASARSGAAVGFGYRTEFNHLGLDVSFLNLQLDEGNRSYGTDNTASSLVKIAGLYVANPTGNASAYFGGGLSYGRIQTSGSTDPSGTGGSYAYGRGSGLQGELTMGYEILRVTSARVFVQGDVTLPFYTVLTESYAYTSPAPGSAYTPPVRNASRQYAPSVAVSVGIGWQRGHRAE